MASFENNVTDVLEDDDEEEEEEEDMNVVLCSASDRRANDERRIAAVNISSALGTPTCKGFTLTHS